jgi:hypothetical protein
MAKGLSPTQRTMRHLRDQGSVCAVVEHFNPYVGEHGIRQDLFGIIDVLALDPTGVWGIQCCGTDYRSHIEKLTVLKAQETTDWLNTPGTRLFIYSWRKVKLQRGGKAMRWSPRISEVKFKDNQFEVIE